MGNAYKTAKRESDGWSWPHYLMLFGLFYGLFSLAYPGHYIVITKFQLSRLVALCSLAGLLLPLKYYKKWLSLDKLEAVFFNVFGIGPVIYGSILLLNFLIVHDRKEEVFAITEKQAKGGDYLSGTYIVFSLENDAYNEYSEIRTVEISDNLGLVKSAKKLKLQTATGLFGYKVVEKKELVE